MGRRFGPLTPAVVLLAWLVGTAQARGHHLAAQAFLLPGRHEIQVEGWFDDGKIPHGARVQVYRANDELLTEGRMDDRGIFVFPSPGPEPLRVVVSAGVGHRKELDLSLAELSPPPPQAAEPGAPPSRSSSAEPVPLADRGTPGWVKDVVVGVSFVLAAAAFLLSVRNSRQLRGLVAKKTR